MIVNVHFLFPEPKPEVTPTTTTMFLFWSQDVLIMLLPKPDVQLMTGLKSKDLFKKHFLQ